MEVNNGPLEVQFQQVNWIDTQREIFFVQDVPVGFSLMSQQEKNIMTYEEEDSDNSENTKTIQCFFQLA